MVTKTAWFVEKELKINNQIPQKNGKVWLANQRAMFDLEFVDDFGN